MNSYFENIVESALKKKLKKKKVVEKDLDEVVDEDGAVIASKIPVDVNVKNTTSKSKTDDVVSMSRQPADTGLTGSPFRRYYGESDMSSQLGYEETLGKDLDYSKAKKYFMDNLKFDEREAEDRLEKLGYVKPKDNPEEKVRLIEEPSKYLEEIVDDILQTREQKEINPIIKRQLISLRDTLAANDLTINDVIDYLN